MSIQVDDAGWGCLLGGVYIGALRVETGEYVSREVPVRFFQPPAFAAQTYLKATAWVVDRLLERLRVRTDEPIMVCRGSIFDAFCAARASDPRITRDKVGDTLQRLVEGRLLGELASLGVMVDYETLTEKQGLLFWYCVRWLKGGDLTATSVAPQRAALAKTGWGTYPIWAEHSYVEAKRLTQEAKVDKARERVRALRGR